MNMDLKSMIDSLRPSELKHYLRSAGWKNTYTFENNLGSIWRIRHNSHDIEVLLPEDLTLLDYRSRVFEVLKHLELVEDRPMSSIAHNISLTGVDVLRFRIASAESRTGAVPLTQGSSLVRGVETMLLSAASATIRPRSYFPRMSYSEARDYLQSCRLGQSEKGSFVLTVMSPVPPTLLTQRALLPEYEVEDAFQRKVLYTLFNGLYHLRNALAAGTSEAIEQTVSQGVSANLCEALTLMQPENDDGELEIGVSWSSVRPVRRNIPQPKIRFTKDVFPLLGEAVKYLRQTAPVEGFEIGGLVRKLDSSDPTTGGRVAVLALMDDKPVNISMSLPAEDYQVAAQAHVSSSMLFCKGTLEKEGKGYTLSNVTDVHIDTELDFE